MTNHPTQAGHSAALPADPQSSECRLCNGLNTSCPDGCDLVVDDAGLVGRMLSAFAGGLVEVPDKANPRGYTIQYLPAIAMQSALPTCGLDEATAQIAKLQADGDKLAVAGEVAKHELEASKPWFSGSRSALASITSAIDGLTQALTEWKDRA